MMPPFALIEAAVDVGAGLQAGNGNHASGEAGTHPRLSGPVQAV